MLPHPRHSARSDVPLTGPQIVRTTLALAMLSAAAAGLAYPALARLDSYLVVSALDRREAFPSFRTASQEQTR